MVWDVTVGVLFALRGVRSLYPDAILACRADRQEAEDPTTWKRWSMFPAVQVLIHISCLRLPATGCKTAKHPILRFTFESHEHHFIQASFCAVARTCSIGDGASRRAVSAPHSRSKRRRGACVFYFMHRLRMRLTGLAVNADPENYRVGI